MRAVVIGSGFGGLAAAIRLAAAGHEVTVLEKRERIGGRAYLYELDGFRFDGGPTVLTAPFMFEELFALAGETLADHVQRGGDQLVERGEEVARRRRRHPGPGRDRAVRRPRDALLGDHLDRGVQQSGPARPAAGPVGGWPNRHA